MTSSARHSTTGDVFAMMSSARLAMLKVKYGWCVPRSTKLNICISTYFWSCPKSPHFPLQHAGRVSASFCLG